MKKDLPRRALALVLTLVLMFALAPASFAIGRSFFNSHTDWHFDLTKHPDDSMTVEEFIALTTAYSYWSTGTQGTAPVDKDGDAPSAWAAPYILSEYRKGTIVPSEIDYQAKVNLAFVMEFFCHAKGLFSYNAVNLRSFTGTEGLNADQKLCLNTAVDYGIFTYTPGMDVSVTIPRKDLEAKYLIPTTDFRTRTPQVIQNAGNYKYSAAFWETNAKPEDSDEYAFQTKQLNVLKDNLDNFNVIIMNMVSLIDGGRGDYNYLYDRIGYCSAHDEMLALCKENGIKVFASVLNYYDSKVLDKMKTSDAVIRAVGDEMLRVLDSHPLDGLSIDLEMGVSTGTTYRECYSRLLRYIAPKVHERGKLLAVTVGAYMQAKEEKASMFDYAAIGECADIVNVINYDDHPAKAYTAGGEMGAVSNYLYVQRCLRYAATCFGADKVMMSYGTFGVDYNTTDHTAVNISHDSVMSLVERYKLKPKTTDANVNDAYVTYTENGKNHTVYYESDQGVYDRIDLAKRYGLGGVTCWLFGWKHDAAFDRMGDDIHALPFSDVARNVNYYDAVSWAYNHTPEQITGGFDATHFAPKNPCTRAQVVTFLWRAAGCPAPANSNNPFVDVSPKQANGKDNPYYNAILWAAEKGITNGSDATHFSPNATVTRAQFVTFLYRYENEPASTGSISIFADANQIAAPYQKAVAWAVERGITNGTDATHFSPKAVCTRWAVVLFMYRDMK